MTSTLAQPGPFDALAKAAPDEPIFPLLAHDPCAPATITEWCRLRRNRAIRLYAESPRKRDQEYLRAELRQVSHAEAVALEMQAWRLREEPSEDAPVKVSYNEVKKTAEELAEADRAAKLAQGVRHFREAAYHLCEAKDALITLGLVGEATQSDLMMMLARINGLADHHTPSRRAILESAVEGV